MPARCIVAGCSNTSKDGVSLHVFPKDDNRRRIWTSKVKLTRGNWKGPSDTSVICSAHFEDSDFEHGLYSLFSLKKLRRLKADAIPIIKSNVVPHAEKKMGVRTAAEKRKKIRVLDELLAEEPSQEAEEVCESEDSLSAEEPSFAESMVLLQQQRQTTISVGTQTFIASRVKRTQTSVQTCDKGSLSRPLVTSRGTMYEIEDDEEDTSSDCPESPNSDISCPKQPSSPGYQPKSSSCNDEQSTPQKPRKRLSKGKRGKSPRSTWQQKSKILPHEETKYIVFETKLMELFETCPACGSRDMNLQKKMVGTLIAITKECWTCNSVLMWESQPYYGNTPAGNVLLSAATLFAGGSCSNTLRLLQNMQVAAITERTFYRHQHYIFEPAIERQWKLSQEAIFTQLTARGTPLTIGGDGRSDSPGHSAKYGVYTAIELNFNKIVDLQLVQSNEVKSSYHMELEGYKRMHQHLMMKGLTIKKLVTDRHRQLAKHVRETTPEIKHMFDVWHVAKGIRKKVHALAKQKGCEIIAEWEQSINNHVYWVAASTKDHEEEMRVDKWKSLENHIQGIHHGHSEIFPSCLHGNLEHEGHRKKWLRPGTMACEKLGDIITSTSLVNDVKKLSTGKQTSSVEAFNSVVNHFAPKLKAYTHQGITSRLHLAALHYNANSDRQQLTTSKGEKCYKVSKPKYKQGKATVKPIRESARFSYVDDLLAEVSRCSKDYNKCLPKRKPAPPSLCSQHTYPTKEELIQQHCSRFSLDA